MNPLIGGGSSINRLIKCFYITSFIDRLLLQADRLDTIAFHDDLDTNCLPLPSGPGGFEPLYYRDKI